MITLHTVLATIMHSVSSLTSLRYKLPLTYQRSRQMHLPQIATPLLHPLPREHRASLRHPPLPYTFHRMPLCTHQACSQLYPPTTMYCPLSSTGPSPSLPHLGLHLNMPLHPLCGFVSTVLLCRFIFAFLPLLPYIALTPDGLAAIVLPISAL